MRDTEALDILRAQGHAVGTPDIHTGQVRVWIGRGDEAVDVEMERTPRTGRRQVELRRDTGTAQGPDRSLD